jgi:hypothetical protein
VKDSCRNLGIVFFVYGAIGFACVLILKYFADQAISKAHIQQAWSNIPGILLRDITSPIQILSLICLIGGILLIAASFVYPRMKPAKTE